ncbi:MAG TPA: glycosyltransferase [Caldilineaceae bacterium]|nr:glycosyltransferase [Caldilineaceae bacterium]
MKRKTKGSIPGNPTKTEAKRLAITKEIAQQIRKTVPNRFDAIPEEWVMDFVPNLISVVIPTYNHERFLVDALDSVLSQSYPYIEIIVVDDGSTDNTPAVMTRYGNRVRYIRQENRGLSGARNTGIQASQGEYIALLDADDFWENNYLREVHAALVADSGLGAVHTGMRFVDAEGNPQAQPGTATVPADQMYERLLDGEFFAPSAVLVRRTVLAAVGLFDLDLRASEDWEIWLRVSRAYRFGGIAKPLLNYRVHGSNMSGNPEQMLRYQLLTLVKHFGPVNGEPATWPTPYRRAFATVAYFAAQGFFYRGAATEGTVFLRLAMEANPDLTASLDLFYELGCVNQPLGQRGDPKTLNLSQNAALLRESLATIFQARDLPDALLAKKQCAYAHAYRALGTLAYNSGQRRAARAYLWQAARHHKSWLSEPSFIKLAIKSLL